MIKVKQINNLIIKIDNMKKIIWFNQPERINPNYGKYAIFAPDGRCLEDGLTLEQAEEYCRETTDFCKRAM